MKTEDKKYQKSGSVRYTKQVESGVRGEPGLRRIQYAQSSAYVLQVMVGGMRRRITLKNPEPRDDFEAVMRARQIKQRLAEGLSLESCKRTISQIVDGEVLPFLRQRSDDPKNQRYCRDLTNRYNAYWRKPLEGLKPDDLSRQCLQRIADNLAPTRPGKEKLAAATYNRALAAISTVGKFLESRGYTDINPARGLQTRRENNRRTRILRDDEFPRFFAALLEFDLQFQLWIKLQLFTCVRQGEALRARWSDVSFAQRTLILRETKNGKSHAVPLSDEAMEVVRQLAALRTNDFLFPGKSGDGHMGRPGRQLKALFTKIGAPDLWCHDLRRTGATMACRNGASIHDISAILNHSNVAVTHRYVMAHAPRLHAALDGAGKLIERLAQGDERGTFTSLTHDSKGGAT